MVFFAPTDPFQAVAAQYFNETVRVAGVLKVEGSEAEFPHGFVQGLGFFGLGACDFGEFAARFAHEHLAVFKQRIGCFFAGITAAAAPAKLLVGQVIGGIFGLLAGEKDKSRSDESKNDDDCFHGVLKFDRCKNRFPETKVGECGHFRENKNEAVSQVPYFDRVYKIYRFNMPF